MQVNRAKYSPFDSPKSMFSFIGELNTALNAAGTPTA